MHRRAHTHTHTLHPTYRFINTDTSPPQQFFQEWLAVLSLPFPPPPSLRKAFRWFSSQESQVTAGEDRARKVVCVGGQVTGFAVSCHMGDSRDRNVAPVRFLGLNLTLFWEWCYFFLFLFGWVCVLVCRFIMFALFVVFCSVISYFCLFANLPVYCCCKAIWWLARVFV